MLATRLAPKEAIPHSSMYLLLLLTLSVGSYFFGLIILVIGDGQ